MFLQNTRIISNLHHFIHFREPSENESNPCQRRNRICLNSRQNFVDITRDAVMVNDKKISEHGYLTVSELNVDVEMLEIDRHVYYIDLKEDLKLGSKLKISING